MEKFVIKIRDRQEYLGANDYWYPNKHEAVESLVRRELERLLEDNGSNRLFSYEGSEILVKNAREVMVLLGQLEAPRICDTSPHREAVQGP